MKRKRSVCLLISAIIGTLYSAYSLSYWLPQWVETAPQLSSIVAAGLTAVMVGPHVLCVCIAVTFNWIGWAMRGPGFSLAGAILYSIAALCMPLYSVFVLAEMILSYIGFAQVRKILSAEADGRRTFIEHSVPPVQSTPIVNARRAETSPPLNTQNASAFVSQPSKPNSGFYWFLSVVFLAASVGFFALLNFSDEVSSGWSLGLWIGSILCLFLSIFAGWSASRERQGSQSWISLLWFVPLCLLAFWAFTVHDSKGIIRPITLDDIETAIQTVDPNFAFSNAEDDKPMYEMIGAQDGWMGYLNGTTPVKVYQYESADVYGDAKDTYAPLMDNWPVAGTFVLECNDDSVVAAFSALTNASHQSVDSDSSNQ